MKARTPSAKSSEWKVWCLSASSSSPASTRCVPRSESGARVAMWGRELDRAGRHVVCELVDEAPVERSRGVDRVRGEEQLAGAGVPMASVKGPRLPRAETAKHRRDDRSRCVGAGRRESVPAAPARRLQRNSPPSLIHSNPSRTTRARAPSRRQTAGEQPGSPGRGGSEAEIAGHATRLRRAHEMPAPPAIRT